MNVLHTNDKKGKNEVTTPIKNSKQSIVLKNVKRNHYKEKYPKNLVENNDKNVSEFVLEQTTQNFLKKENQKQLIPNKC